MAGASVDVEPVVAAVFPATAKGLNPSTRQGFTDALNARQILAYTGARAAGDCKMAGNANQQAYNQQGILQGAVAGGVGGAVSGGLNAGLPLIPVVGPILAQLWTKINPFAHHAAAVAKEQSTLCLVVPEINAALLQVDRDFAAGNLTLQQANQELDGIYSEYLSATQAIYQEAGTKCNAACVVGHEVQGEVLIRKQTYATMGLPPTAYVKKYGIWIGVIIVAFLLFRRR